MIEDKLKSANQPLIIAGHEINSFNLHKELEEFVNQTNIPVAQLSLGKVPLMKKTLIILEYLMVKLLKIRLKIMLIIVTRS